MDENLGVTEREFNYRRSYSGHHCLQFQAYADLTCFGCRSLKQLRTDVQKDDASYKDKELQEKGTGSYGYGGKFGVQKDRMDKVFKYQIEELSTHKEEIDCFVIWFVYNL